MLMIKKSFQFLNAFSLGLQNKKVFAGRQSSKVTRSIISFDAVKMMNYPTIRQRFSIDLFPNSDMFKDITRFVRFSMSWLLNIDITCFYKTAFCTRYEESFSHTTFASCGKSRYLLPAIYTRMQPTLLESFICCFVSSSPSCSGLVFRTMFASLTYKFSTFRARMFMFLCVQSVIFCILFAHVFIIPQNSEHWKISDGDKVILKKHFQTLLKELEERG